MQKESIKHRLQEQFECPACGQKKAAIEILSGLTVRPILVHYVNHFAPKWSLDQNICMDCLNKARSEFVEESLVREKGELTQAEMDVIEAIKNHELISTNIHESETPISFGDQLSDKLASVGGSWRFIIGFCSILILWVGINSIGLMYKPFDPYPYILLNLVLSCLAAIQAPVIMMSQNRQEAKDRARAEADYKTNLKAELEIRHLHLKLDQLVSHQWHRLLEIQQIQLDMMKDMNKRNE